MIAPRHYFASMAGRLFLVLATGTIGAAMFGVLLTLGRSDAALERQAIERTVDRVEGFTALIEESAPQLRAALLASHLGPGVQVEPAATIGGPADESFSEALNRRGGALAGARAQSADLSVCAPPLDPSARNALESALRSEPVQRALQRNSGDAARIGPPRCRLVDATLRDGTALRLSVQTPPLERERSPLLDPSFITWLVLSLAALAYVVARIASAPLQRLARAAGALGRDLHRPALPTTGPAEVRAAAAAFNLMQQQLQQHVSERTQMLAAITHDLQTPLTKLRLRLEWIEDEQLRQRLVDDLNHMKVLIDEGLELARSTDTSERPAPVDLDSLLESVVEDAQDAGGQAELGTRSAAVLELRPLAVRRLVGNLVDNAIKYGGRARVDARREGAQVLVTVRDGGEGLPPELLERVFQPFFRAEGSRSRATGGVGLGLTVARMLAERNGAHLTLCNHPEGGLECRLSWSVAA